jgi:hypothetical protein
MLNKLSKVPMKLSKKKKSLAIITLAAAIIGAVGTNASASSAGGDILGMLQKAFLGDLPQQLTGLINQKGDLSIEKTLEQLSKQGVESASRRLPEDGWGTASAGQISDSLYKDAIEKAADSNQKAHAEALKEFEDTAPLIDEIATTNEQESKSSLEAGDKTNKLSAAIITTAQRQIAATQRLTTAQQIQNSNTIREMQIAKTKELRTKINNASDREDIDNTRALTLNRWEPDGAGGMRKIESGVEDNVK